MPNFIVDAWERSVATVTVAAGETWRFQAEGEWRDAWIPCGPKGYRNFLADVLGIRPRAPQLPWFCLVGMIKDAPGSEFCIGEDAEHTFHTGGEVVVFANDKLARYANNYGSVMLQAEQVTPAPTAPLARSLAGSRPRAVELLGDIAAAVGGAWNDLRAMLERTAGVLFALVLTLLAGFALAFMDQGVDLVRTVGEDSSAPAAGRQFAFAVTLFFLGVQAWFWPRMIIESNYGRDRKQWRPRRLLEWTPRVLGVLPFVFALIALWRGPSPETYAVIGLVVLGLGLFVFLVLRTRLFGRARGRFWRDLGPAWAIFSFALAVLAMVAVTVWPVDLPVLIGAPAVVFLAFGLFIPPTLTLIQLSRGFRLPMFGALLLLAVVASSWLDNHMVGARAAWTAEVRAPDQPVSLWRAYGIWRAQAQGARAPDGSLPIVLVASEGGASRAGFWTGEALSALSARFPDFHKSVFAISSVSGGSVGAVGYVAALDEARSGSKVPLETRISGFTGADALSPALGGMLFPDLLQRFIPIALLPDRAQALEKAWEAAWADRCPDKGLCGLLSGPFQDLWKGLAPASWAPLVIVNGAGEENGRPLLTSKLRFASRVMDADDFYQINKTDIAASTAIHNGARFPWISPAGRMPCPGGHIVDGGYFEGSGLETIRQLALAIQQGPGRNDKLRFIVVFIAYKPPPPPASKTFLNDVNAPFAAIFNARAAAGPHMVTALVKDFQPGPAADPYKTAASAPGAVLPGVYAPILLRDGAPRGSSTVLSPPLDWALSKPVQAYMRQSMGFDGGKLSDENQAAFDLIAQALKGPPAPAAPPSASLAARRKKA